MRVARSEISRLFTRLCAAAVFPIFVPQSSSRALYHDENCSMRLLASSLESPPLTLVLRSIVPAGALRAERDNICWSFTRPALYSLQLHPYL